MATAGYKGRLDIQTLTTGVIDVTAPATYAASASGWEELKFTNATITDTRETDDITENGDQNRDFDTVLRNWSFTCDFVRKTTGQTGYQAQQDLFAEFDKMTQRAYIRLVDTPGGTGFAVAAGDVAKFGEVKITGITETNDVGTDVRVSMTFQGTGPLVRADLT